MKNEYQDLINSTNDLISSENMYLCKISFSDLRANKAKGKWFFLNGHRVSGLQGERTPGERVHSNVYMLNTTELHTL